MPNKATDLLTKIFSNKSGSARNDRLVTDAAPLDDMYERSLGKGTSSKTPDSTYTQPVATTTLNQPTQTRQLEASLPVNIAGTSTPASASLTKFAEPHEMPGLDIVPPSNSLTAGVRSPPAGDVQPMCVNNTQGYNVYQFSQISGLHIGSVYNISSQHQNQTLNVEQTTAEAADTAPTPYRKTKTIDSMMKSNDPLTHRHMDIVSTHLGEGWRDIIRLLGFSEGQIEQMYEDNYARGIKESIYGFLLDYSRNDEQASVGHLTRLLWKSGRRECVFLLKEYWKGTQPASTASSASSLKDES